MTRRIFDSNIWTNEHFGEMPMMARLLLLGIINHADDQGRTKAHAVFLRAQIFPYDDITKEQIDECLKLIEANGTIALYEANGKRYLQLLNWWEYQSLQFAIPSEHPHPDNWHDRIRYNTKGNLILTCNWVTVAGIPLDNTCDEDGDPLPIVATLPPKNHGGRPRINPPGNVGEKVPGNVPTIPPGNVNLDQDQIEDQDQEKAAEPPARLRESEADKDGRFTMQLLRDTNLFFSFGSDARQTASGLEEIYAPETIRRAISTLVIRHHSMVDKSGKGIHEPLGFLAKLLAEDFKTIDETRVVKVEVRMAPCEWYPDGHTIYTKMSLTAARKDGYKIVEHLQ